MLTDLREEGGRRERTGGRWPPAHIPTWAECPDRGSGGQPFGLRGIAASSAAARPGRKGHRADCRECTLRMYTHSIAPPSPLSPSRVFRHPGQTVVTGQSVPISRPVRLRTGLFWRPGRSGLMLARSSPAYLRHGQGPPRYGARETSFLRVAAPLAGFVRPFTPWRARAVPAFWLVGEMLLWGGGDVCIGVSVLRGRGCWVMPQIYV